MTTLGWHHSEEHKQKMRVRFLGRKMSPESCEKMRIAHLGKPGNHFGHHLTTEQKRKVSETTKQGMNVPALKLKLSNHAKKRVKELSPHWQGGISFEPYTPEFNRQLKKQIQERDNHICQLCGSVANGHRMCVHHIDYVKYNLNPLNLISLCRNCHTKTNTRRKYWKERLTNLMSFRQFEYSKQFALVVI